MADSTIGLGFDFSKMLSQNPGAGQALGDMAKEMQKLDGVPIMQVMRMGTTANGQPLPAASEAPLPALRLPRPAQARLRRGMASMISSHVGRLRIRQEETRNPPPDQNANQNSAQAQPTSAILMETQITTSNFSSAPVDPSHFEIPAGYKQAQPAPMTPAPATAQH